MDNRLGSDFGVGIGDALTVGATLMVRHLARGTSLTSRTVLSALDEDGPSRLTALATATGIAQPAMTQLASRLEREGLVVRLIDPDDARATLVAITDAGRALRAELHQSMQVRMAELLDRMSADDRHGYGQLTRFLTPDAQAACEPVEATPPEPVLPTIGPLAATIDAALDSLFGPA